jgi:hypothetical protein
MSASNPLRRARDSAVRSALIWRCSASETGGFLRPHRPPWASRRIVRAITMIWSGRLRRPPIDRSSIATVRLSSATPCSSSAVQAEAKSLKLQGKLYRRTMRTQKYASLWRRESLGAPTLFQPETLFSPVSSSGWPARSIWGSRHMPMLRHACGYKPANVGHDTRAIQARIANATLFRLDGGPFKIAEFVAIQGSS